MKRLFFLVIVLALSLTVLASCDTVKNVLGSTLGEICQHRDANDDNLCDKCGKDYTDGADVDFCQHRDKTDDGKCDKCGKTYSDGADVNFCQHRDADDNDLCDRCGENYTDDKDIPDPSDCQHRDADDNRRCDKCKEVYSDGCDLATSHNFIAWKIFSENGSNSCQGYIFSRTCSICGAVEWKNGTYDDHKFSISISEPTCKNKGTETKTCSICGLVETNSIPITTHAYSTSYTSDNATHWLRCNYCETKIDEADHTPNSDGFCSVCNRPIGATEGVIYDKSADGTYALVVGYTGSSKRVIIADTYNGLPVKSIYNEAFKGTSITEVVIPDTITSIGVSAFDNCNNLASLHISDVAAWCAIGLENAASNPLCYAKNLYLNGELVTELVIPEGVEKIGNYAFRNCDSLTSIVIPDSVTSIGNYAFYSCEGLTNAAIPDSVTSIGNYAFYKCTYLKSATIGSNIAMIGDYAFYDCRRLTSVTIEGAPTLGNAAFSECNSALYTDYEYCRYVGCEENPYEILLSVTNANLSTYTIHEDTKAIGYGAFKSCTRLTEIVIPDSVRAISSDAFYDCSNLTNVYISSFAKWCEIEFGNYSANPLYYANNLYLNGELLAGDLVIPDGVEKIGSYAFSNCYNLKSIVIPESVTSIGDGAFYNCSGLTSVVIPDSVTSIGYDSFSNCSKLTSVIIPDSVTSIGSYAFYNCSSLTSITIGSGVKTVGSHAFYYCEKLKNVYISDIAAWCGISFVNYFDNPIYYAANLYINGELLVGDLVIPEGVEKVGDYAFDNYDAIISVVIPDSVTSIGVSAFYGCDNLLCVSITCSVTSIGYQAFASCDSLTNIVIPDSVTSIGEKAFYWCSNLTIYCEAKSKPDGWDSNWNPSGCPVVWGYEASEE